MTDWNNDPFINDRPDEDHLFVDIIGEHFTDVRNLYRVLDDLRDAGYIRSEKEATAALRTREPDVAGWFTMTGYDSPTEIAGSFIAEGSPATLAWVLMCNVSDALGRILASSNAHQANLPGDIIIDKTVETFREMLKESFSSYAQPPSPGES